MTNKSFKGQAAVEYLMTYGWAILVLVIIVAAIFSTGIMSPSYLVSEECNIGPNLPCNFQLYSDGNNLKLKVNVTNGFGYKINMTIFTANLTEDQKEFVITRVSPAADSAIDSGGSITLTGSLSPHTAAKNSIKKIKIETAYYSCAPEINKDCILDPTINVHTISGRIVGRVA